MVNKIKKILEAQLYAKSRNGQCLSNEYIDSREKLEWKCSNSNHSSWFSTFSNMVRRKCWCTACGIINNSDKRKIKNGLEQAQQHAKNNNGLCLSTAYIASRSKLEWKCCNSNHSSWFSTFDSAINKKNWCLKCSTEKNLQRWRKQGLQNAHNYA